MEMKKCSKCGEEKELTAEYWHKDKSKKDGYRGQCKECMKEYYYKNQEEKRKKAVEYYYENREAKLEYQEQYYKDNREKISEYYKQYLQSEQGRKNNAKSEQNRRARKAQLPNTLTTEEYENTLEYFNHTCAYCGCELNKDNHHMEHIVPISKGGGTTQKNIIPSCESCNWSKHAKTLADWYRFSDDFSIEKLAQIAKHLAQFTDWVVSSE